MYQKLKFSGKIPDESSALAHYIIRPEIEFWTRVFERVRSWMDFSRIIFEYKLWFEPQLAFYSAVLLLVDLAVININEYFAYIIGSNGDESNIFSEIGATGTGVIPQLNTPDQNLMSSKSRVDHSISRFSIFFQ